MQEVVGAKQEGKIQSLPALPWPGPGLAYGRQAGRQGGAVGKGGWG